MSDAVPRVPPGAPVRASRALLATLLLLACNDAITAPSRAEELVVIAGGTDASGRVILEGADRFDTVMVRVLDASARPVPNVAITWSTDDPDALVTPLDDASDADGVVRAEWRLSGAPGTWKLRAIASTGAEAEAAFTVTSWSVQHAVFVAGRTCVQSHDDRLWCRANDLAPLELQLGGATIRELRGAWGTGPSRSQFCVLTTGGVIECAEVSSTPLQFSAVPGQSTEFITFAMSAYPGMTCGIDTAGRAWCWGAGYLGDGPRHNTAREEPGPVTQAAEVTFSAIVVNNDNGCALDEDGTPWCWGHGTDGVPGPASSPPAEIPRPVPVPFPLKTITLPDHGGSACGLTEDRRAICWGNGITFGVQGTGLAPASLAGVGDAVDLVPLPDGYLARRSKGELIGWGSVSFGHSGGPDETRSLPRGSAIRTRAVSPGLLGDGRTCIDEASGRGTVCARSWDLAGTQFTDPLLWIGLQPPD